MATMWVQGVVRNGQVVLDPALDLPDGTVVTVIECDPAAEPRPVGSTTTLSAEVLAVLAAFWRRETTWAEAEKRIQELQAQP